MKPASVELVPAYTPEALASDEFLRHPDVLRPLDLIRSSSFRLISQMILADIDRPLSPPELAKEVGTRARHSLRNVLRNEGCDTYLNNTAVNMGMVTVDNEGRFRATEAARAALPTFCAVAAWRLNYSTSLSPLVGRLAKLEPSSAYFHLKAVQLALESPIIQLRDLLPHRGTLSRSSVYHRLAGLEEAGVLRRLTCNEPVDRRMRIGTPEPIPTEGGPSARQIHRAATLLFNEGYTIVDGSDLMEAFRFVAPNAKHRYLWKKVYGGHWRNPMLRLIDTDLFSGAHGLSYVLALTDVARQPATDLLLSLHSIQNAAYRERATQVAKDILKCPDYVRRLLNLSGEEETVFPAMTPEKAQIPAWFENKLAESPLPDRVKRLIGRGALYLLRHNAVESIPFAQKFSFAPVMKSTFTTEECRQIARHYRLERVIYEGVQPGSAASEALIHRLRDVLAAEVKYNAAAPA